MAVFKCRVSNTSFELHWIVDDTAANFWTIKDRGVTIVPINTTTSYLHIIGHKRNNNTRVQCTGRLFDGYRVIDYEPSDVVILRIYGKMSTSKVYTSADPMEAKTLQQIHTTLHSLSPSSILFPHPKTKSSTGRLYMLKC